MDFVTAAWCPPWHIGITIVEFIAENRMSEMLCICDCTRPHTSVLITEALKKFGWTVVQCLLCSPVVAPSGCILFGPLKCRL